MKYYNLIIIFKIIHGSLEFQNAKVYSAQESHEREMDISEILKGKEQSGPITTNLLILTYICDTYKFELVSRDINEQTVNGERLKFYDYMLKSNENQ